MTARERFVELLAATGLTQAEVARRVGEVPQWVNNRVRGLTEIKADDIPRLAEALRVPPSAFFEPAPALSDRELELAALRNDPDLVEAISAAVVRVVSELSPRHRDALLAMGKQPPGEEGRRPGASDARSRIAEKGARYLEQLWDDLPEEEQRRLVEMVESRQSSNLDHSPM